MASAELKKGTEEYMMFLDFWNLCKRFWTPEQKDDYWKDLINETDKFYKKYHTPYAKNFALGLVNALDEVSRGGENGEHI